MKYQDVLIEVVNDMTEEMELKELNARTDAMIETLEDLRDEEMKLKQKIKEINFYDYHAGYYDTPPPSTRVDFIKDRLREISEEKEEIHKALTIIRINKRNRT